MDELSQRQEENKRILTTSISCDSLSFILTVRGSVVFCTGLTSLLQLESRSSQSRLASGFPWLSTASLWDRHRVEITTYTATSCPGDTCGMGTRVWGSLAGHVPMVTVDTCLRCETRATFHHGGSRDQGAGHQAGLERHCHDMSQPHPAHSLKYSRSCVTRFVKRGSWLVSFTDTLHSFHN